MLRSCVKPVPKVFIASGLDGLLNTGVCAQANSRLLLMLGFYKPTAGFILGSFHSYLIKFSSVFNLLLHSFHTTYNNKRLFSLNIVINNRRLV